MAWPNDAVLNTYSPGQQVRSADLNDWQNRIVDLHRDRYRHVTSWRKEVNADVDGWKVTGGPGEETGWICQVANDVLWGFIDLPDGAILKEVDVGVNTITDTGLTVRVVREDMNWDAGSYVGPSAPTLLGSGNPTGTTDEIVSVTAIAHTVTDQNLYFLTITSADVGDVVHGARFLYEPITPTP